IAHSAVQRPDPDEELPQPPSRGEPVPETHVLVQRIRERGSQPMPRRAEPKPGDPVPFGTPRPDHTAREQESRPAASARASNRGPSASSVPSRTVARAPAPPRAVEPPRPVPDVHIHIGRVELTALMAPEKPRRQTAATVKQPMSLDEYLRRRSGGTT